MSAFYHIYVSPRQGVTADQVKQKMNLAIDWFKYDDKNWVVYTTSDSKKWYSRFQQYVEPGGHIFICRLNISDFWGFMSKSLWEWLRKPRPN